MSGSEDDKSPAVLFEYIKTPAFRVLHADGVIGGLTPSGNIHVAFYSERPPFPRKLSFSLNQDGTLGDLIPSLTETREGIIRELDVDIVMSLAVAESMLQWLAAQVDARKAGLQPTSGDVK